MSKIFLKSSEEFKNYIDRGATYGWNTDIGWFVDVPDKLSNAEGVTIEGENEMSIEQKLEDLKKAIEDNTKALHALNGKAATDAAPVAPPAAAKPAPAKKLTPKEQAAEAKRQEIINELTTLGVEFDPKGSFVSLQALLADAKKAQTATDDFTADEDDSFFSDEELAPKAPEKKDYTVDEVRDLANKAIKKLGEEKAKAIFVKHGKKITELSQDSRNALAAELKGAL